MSNIFIILAGGINKRLKSKTPKPYIKINNKELIQYSIEAASAVKNINRIVIVYNIKHQKYLKDKKFNKYLKVKGGKTRAESSYNALKKIKKYKCKNILIHDAARANISNKLIEKIIKALENNNTAIPALHINDSIKKKIKKKISNVDRNNLYQIQTPQGFKFKEILKLNERSFDPTITDDASLYINKNKKINLINGDINNIKITSKKDLETLSKFKQKKIYYGIGFDVHRLVKNKKLFIGGINIPFHLGTLGHSDGDPVLHAIIDSILGACKMGDIGEKFSDKNKKYKNIRSTILLKNIINQIKIKKIYINNIDINIIIQKPKISKFKNKIVDSISKICEILPNQINIKGKTTEKLGLIGKEKAIACEVITSVAQYE